MAGIMNKIGETLHIGGKKEGEQQQHKGEGQHKTEQPYGQQHQTGQHQTGEHQTGQYQGGGEGQRKEGGGILDKVKDKIHGGGTGGTQDHENKGEKKKKKEKKKKHEGGHDSSSSDSD